MAGEVCCVCGVAVGASGVPHEGRFFCDGHRAGLGRRRGLAGAVAWLIVGVAALAGLAAVLSPWLRATLSGPGLATVAVLLAIVPAVLWLAVFHAQDREPEPRTMVLKVFLLGALLAAAVGEPLIAAFDLSSWAREGLLARLLAGVLVVGVVQETLKYAAVRHSVYPSAVYDQPIDGIVYAAAAGLGYATAVNLRWTFDVVVPDPGVAASRFAVTSLAHASFAAVVGHFVGRAKFEERGGAWLPAGLLAAAAVNGVVTVALGIVRRPGRAPRPHWGLLLAAAVAVVAFGAATWLLRRARGDVGRPASSTAFGWRREAAVWGLVLALLVSAAALRAAAVRSTREYEGGGLTLRYPASWAALSEATPAEPLHVGDPDESAAAPTSLRVTTVPLAELAPPAEDGAGPPTVGDLVVPWCERRQRSLLGWRIFDLERAEVGGAPAMVLDAAHVAEASAASTSPTLPEVVRTREVLWLRGDAVVVVSLSTRAETWRQQEPLRRRVLDGVRWRP
jgi:RsiW-degrading membrane proteinase PrsW (M82 family)